MFSFRTHREEANALEESLLKQWRSIYQSWQLLSAAGGTTEIVVNGSTWLLHPVGKSGVTLLAKNMIKLATHVEQRLTMGRRGYERVKEMFLEVHMAQRISTVFMDILQSKSH